MIPSHARIKLLALDTFIWSLRRRQSLNEWNRGQDSFDRGGGDNWRNVRNNMDLKIFLEGKGQWLLRQGGVRQLAIGHFRGVTSGSLGLGGGKHPTPSYSLVSCSSWSWFWNVITLTFLFSELPLSISPINTCFRKLFLPLSLLAQYPPLCHSHPSPSRNSIQSA